MFAMVALLCDVAGLIGGVAVSAFTFFPLFTEVPRKGPSPKPISNILYMNGSWRPDYDPLRPHEVKEQRTTCRGG